MKKITVAAVVEQIENIQNFISSELETVNCSMKVQAQISIALDEILSNIVYYAYPETPGVMGVSCDIYAERITIIIEDSGVPYNPLAAQDPDVTLPAEDREVGGLGIYMVKKTMDELNYEYKDSKNILTMSKKIIN